MWYTFYCHTCVRKNRVTRAMSINRTSSSFHNFNHGVGKGRAGCDIKKSNKLIEKRGKWMKIPLTGSAAAKGEQNRMNDT